PPHFAGGQAELQRQPTHRAGAVRDVGLAARQGEATEHGHASALEDGRPREARAVPVAFEEPRYAEAFGVVPAEAGVDAVDALECIDEPRRGQRSRCEPSAEIGEAPREDEENQTDERQSGYRARDAEGLTLGFDRLHAHE